MSSTCRDCGQHHETFIDGVVCDVERKGPAAARTALVKFCDDAVADSLIAQAEQQLALTG